MVGLEYLLEPDGQNVFSLTAVVRAHPGVIYFGRGALTAGDLDLDGQTELIVGTTTEPELGYQGMLVVRPPDGWTDTDTSTALAGFSGGEFSIAGWAREFGDVNGDGLPDLVSAASDGGFPDSLGALSILFGRVR